MNDLARQRLFDYRLAFDDPSVLFLCWVVGAVFAAAALAIAILALLPGPGPSLRREISRRTLAWAVMVPLVMIPILLGAAWTILLFTILSLLCYREFARASGLFRDKTMSALIVLGILALAFAALDHWYGLFVALSPLTIIVLAAAAILADRPKGYIQRVGLSSLAFLLFGVCLAHLSYFANDAHYRALLMLLLICVGLNDVFAFCVGKSVGGGKLAPNTSPNKTIAGSVGAIVLTTLLFFALGSRVFAGTLLASPIHLLAMGAIVSIAGQLGDLTISSIKRDIGIKDMGTLIPGHGGVLDRCNSLLLAAPALFHYVGYFVGVGLDQWPRIFTGSWQ